MALLMTPPVLMFLGFFIAYGMASGGLSAFTVIGLIELQGLSLDLANMALTGHLFGVVGGVALGGFIVDRFRRHGVTAAIAFLCSPEARYITADTVALGAGMNARNAG